MKIAILGTYYSPPFIRGGQEAVIHELKRELERRGHAVDAYTPAFRKWRALDAASDATNTFRLPVWNIRFLYHFTFARKLSRALADKSYDVILNTHALLGHRLGQRPHVVVVATTARGEAGSMDVTGPVKFIERIVRNTLEYVVEKRVFRYCDRIIGVCDHICDEVCDLYGVPREKVVFIGNGVDCRKFSPAEGADEDKTQNGPPVILYVGRLVSRKNVALLVRAAAVLRDRGVNFRVHICGEGELLHPLEALCRSLDLTGHVEFLGRVNGDRLPQEYRRSDVFVLPSRYEGMPMVLLEAQSCGLPAIVAGFRGAEKIIQQAENGFIMSEHSPQELADLLAGLLADEDKRRAMGWRARAMMVDRFSWETVVDEYLRCLMSASPNPRTDRVRVHKAGTGN